MIGIPRVQPFKTTAKGLVGCWPAFEGAGPVLHDVSGYPGQHFAASGGAPWIDGVSAGDAGYAPMVSLNGSTQYFQMPTVTQLNFDRLQPFSIVVNTTFTNAGNEESLCGCLDPSNNYIGWELHKESSVNGNYIGFFLINTFPTNCIQVDSNFVPGAGTPYQIVVTYNGGSLASGLQFWVNSVLQSKQAPLQDNLTTTAVGTVPLIIGRRNNATIYHAGNWGEFRIYNRVLAPSEIWDIYAGNG